MSSSANINSSLYIYYIFIVLTFIIHLTVVETSSFSKDFYRNIFKEILAYNKKKTKLNKQNWKAMSR